MSRPTILTLYLDTWYGRGQGVSSDKMLFGNGLFDSLGLEEHHIPLEDVAALPSAGKFDLVFIVPFETVLDLRAHGPVVAWMCDDVWRYASFGQLWTEVADLVVTTDPASAALYKDKAILSNWACRPEWESLVGAQQQALQASFYGQMYGRRKDILSAIEENCPVPLDLNDTTEQYFPPEDYFAAMAKSAFSICLTESSHSTRQMKSRLFEPQLFGSILVTEPTPGLENYWQPGNECIVFTNPQEFASAVEPYVRSAAERTAMAERARRRLLAEHTYQNRFRAVLDRMGVSV